MSLEEHYSFYCPHCGSDNSLPIDLTGGSRQRLVLDCETCCSPIVVRVRLSGQDILSVDVQKENE